MIYSDKQQKEFTKIICKKSNILADSYIYA